jgi:glucosamine--fructose-6-phosphate aminotransferase (isomerizing)
LITDQRGATEAGMGVWDTIIMPEIDPFLAPILYAVPAQLLAYHTAVAKGTDVDQPRNLAKSVTVE